MAAKTITVTYIEHGGREHRIQVPEGWSLMEGAVKHLVPGIDADCGGACACATCQVFVDGAWLERLPPKSDMEETMLDFAPETRPESRLSCQLRATADLDGIVLRLPKSQH
jgi:2Fe-2S ferredoxin